MISDFNNGLQGLAPSGLGVVDGLVFKSATVVFFDGTKYNPTFNGELVKIRVNPALKKRSIYHLVAMKDGERGDMFGYYMDFKKEGRVVASYRQGVKCLSWDQTYNTSADEVILGGAVDEFTGSGGGSTFHTWNYDVLQAGIKLLRHVAIDPYPNSGVGLPCFKMNGDFDEISIRTNQMELGTHPPLPLEPYYIYYFLGCLSQN